MSRHLLELLNVADPRQCWVRLITPRGTRETSFAELWALSSRMARAVERSLGPGSVAGILTPCAEAIAHFVGCLRAGRDFVSLPLPGRGQDALAYGRQIATILDLSRATAVVVEAAYGDLLRSLPEPLRCPILVAEELAEAARDGLRADPLPGRLVQFSSGTTGTPKGVRLTTEAIAASVEATLDALDVHDRPESFCSWLPLSHDMGLIGGLLGSWVGCTRTRPGYRYTLLGPELFLSRPLLWMETCSAVEATVTAAPTFAYHVASRHLPRSGPLNLASLRACMVGAEPIGADTLRAFTSLAGAHGLREGAMCPAYGLAEATLGVSMVRPGERWTERRVRVDGRENDYVSCGRPLGCVEVDAPAEGAEAGPIRVRGPALLEGYVPDRPARADAWLDTGDLGVLAGGELFVTGRSDDLLCVAGRNLFAWELEQAAHGIPGVRPGDVAVVPDGRGQYAVLVEVKGSPADLDAVLSEVRRKVAGVAGVGPSTVACIPRGSLLKTPSGKARRSLMAAELGRLLSASLAHREW